MMTILASYAGSPLWVLILTTLGPPALVRVGLEVPGLRALRVNDRHAVIGQPPGCRHWVVSRSTSPTFS